jgi:hypothetical protein
MCALCREYRRNIFDSGCDRVRNLGRPRRAQLGAAQFCATPGLAAERSEALPRVETFIVERITVVLFALCARNP